MSAAATVVENYQWRCVPTAIGWAHFIPHSGCPDAHERNRRRHLADCDICSRIEQPVCLTAIKKGLNT